MKLFSYLKPYIKESILSPLFKLLEASFELIVPVIIIAILDYGIPHSDHNYIYKRCFLLVGLGLVGMACSLTAQYFAAKSAVGFTKQVRRALYEHIQKLSYADIDRMGASTLITRLTNDMMQVQTGVNLTLRLLLRSPMVVFGSLIMAYWIDPKISIVFICVILLLALVVGIIMRISIPLYRKVQNKLDRVTELTKENLTGVRVIRAFANEDREIQTFEGANVKLSGMQQKVGIVSMLMNPLTYIIINAGVIALIWSGAIEVGHGRLSQGAVVALYNYMSQILVELVKLANLIITVAKSVACANRIQSVLEITPSLADAGVYQENMNDSEDFIVFSNAALQYPEASAPAVRDVSFHIKKGETVGIIGGTGSGKSSLIHLIARLYDPTEGNVFIGGIDSRKYPLQQLRMRLGLVPQQAVLFQGTIRENIRWGKKDATDAEIWEALELAQAADFVREKEGTLDYVIEQGSKNLSGGQRQRLTIARALVRKPEILILDDSSSALDYATDAALQRSIRTLSAQGTTIIVVTQRSASIMHADRIFVLDEGRIIGNGKHEELCRTCRVYRDIYETQFPGEGV